MFHSSLLVSAACRSVVCRTPLRLLSTSMAHNKKHVAVVLSGCGVYDGTEIHEASAVLVHLSRAGAKVSMFAPDVPQMHVINHCKGEPTEETRNVLQESARIARGNISALSNLDVATHDAVVFPGGFGAAKNLSTFAKERASCKVNEEVEKTIKAFHTAKKPIGLCCIAPVLAAKVISGCEVTIGNDEGTAEAIEGMGGKHVNKSVLDTHIDEHNKVVTTPAYMFGDAELHKIHDGIGKMIDGVLKLADQK